MASVLLESRGSQAKRGVQVSEEKEEHQVEGEVTVGLEPQRRRNNRHFLMFWCAFIVALFVFPGSGADGFVFCPFRAWTGYSCPGCGMTRACTTFVRGDVWHSLEYHPLGALLVLWLTVVALLRGVELWKGRRILQNAPEWVHRAIRLGTIAIFVFVLLFGGARLVLEIAGILTPV